MSITRQYLEERRAELLKSLEKLRQDAQATDGALQLCAFLIDKCAALDKAEGLPSIPETAGLQLVPPKEVQSAVETQS